MRPMLQPHRLRSFFIIAAYILFHASCSDPALDKARQLALEEFKQNEQRWKSQNISDYRFKLRMQCYCPIQYLGPNIIEVRRGVAESITYAGDSRNLDMSKVQLPDTVEKLFAIIRGMREVTVTYDPILGYPSRIQTIDRSVEHHNSTTYVITNFEVVR